MDKIVIEYDSLNNRKIARDLEKAAVAVLERHHVDKVIIGQYTQYIPGKSLFTYVGADDSADRDGILDTLYSHLTGRPDIDMCGPESREALQELKDVLDPQVYLAIEEKITAGFAENARNGFRHGFECMGKLMTGGRA